MSLNKFRRCVQVINLPQIQYKCVCIDFSRLWLMRCKLRPGPYESMRSAETKCNYSCLDIMSLWTSLPFPNPLPSPLNPNQFILGENLFITSPQTLGGSTPHLFHERQSKVFVAIPANKYWPNL